MHLFYSTVCSADLDILCSGYFRPPVYTHDFNPGGLCMVRDHSLSHFSLLHSRFQCRHATLLPTVSGEERCVTTRKTAVQQTNLTSPLIDVGGRDEIMDGSDFTIGNNNYNLVSFPVISYPDSSGSLVSGRPPADQRA